MNLIKVLAQHSLWLQDSTKGQRADLCGANLSGADLRGANLCETDLFGANLRGANLRETDLRGANLRGADLRETDLRGTDLRGANLSGADLRGADLYKANLSGADLFGADLRGADLYKANLRGADLRGADLYSFQLSKHFGYMHISHKYPEGNIIRIGCEEYSVDYWLKHYIEIGKKHEYSEFDCKIYGLQLRLLAEIVQSRR